VIEVDLFEIKMKFCRYRSVTTHIEWAKLTGTKIRWHIGVIDSFCDFRVTTGPRFNTFYKYI
jgi:hypothetical protein